MSHAAAIELRKLNKSYGSLEIIRDLDLTVTRGERHAIIGPNGAGKSTLIGMMSGLTPLSSGEILVNGTRINGMPPRRINALGLARSFQITRIFPRLSAFENLRIGVMARHGIRYGLLRPVSAYRGVTLEAEELLASVRLDARAGTPAGELSYAEQRALELAMALTSKPEVLLLDEPTAGMSREETRSVVELLRTVAQDRTLLLVEHDMEVVFTLCNRITVLAYGEVIASGPPEEISKDARVQKAYLGEGFGA